MAQKNIAGMAIVHGFLHRTGAGNRGPGSSRSRGKTFVTDGLIRVPSPQPHKQGAIGATHQLVTCSLSFALIDCCAQFHCPRRPALYCHMYLQDRPCEGGRSRWKPSKKFCMEVDEKKGALRFVPNPSLIGTGYLLIQAVYIQAGAASARDASDIIHRPLPK